LLKHGVVWQDGRRKALGGSRSKKLNRGLAIKTYLNYKSLSILHAPTWMCETQDPRSACGLSNNDGDAAGEGAYGRAVRKRACAVVRIGTTKPNTNLN
jgi:hypothetical protein